MKEEQHHEDETPSTFMPMGPDSPEKLPQLCWNKYDSLSKGVKPRP